MKLNLVPARTGILWVKLGIRTFLRQPLGLAGLFFVYMAVVAVLSLIPVLGTVISLVITPAATLGLLVASQQAAEGRFPLPGVLASAFRAGQQRLRSMLQLGFIYALCVQAVMLIVSLVFGAQSRPETPGQIDAPTLLTFALFIPISVAFWFAPALVHWHGVTPVKSIFFSLVAVLGNIRAFLVYGLTWAAVIAVVVMAVSLVVTVLGSEQIAPLMLMPLALVMAVMVIASTYFSFVDSFRVDAPSQAPPEIETP